ncbi:Phenylalanine racemase (ATP-hydrolyzing) [Mycolicibacterium rhodesiae JS60]|nr:Phenylalanine racemase (ATP-hydrolyzing) [Mycolicibacterium rhodesiae JS60]
MRDLLGRMACFGDRLAVATATDTLTYRELGDRVADSAATLGSDRRLVLLETANTVPALIAYLGTLAGGHVAIPVSPRVSHTALLDSYDPDVVVDAAGTIRHRRQRSAHRLHPDLALLLSTSGSTGSPKLVRLSATNLSANAAAIADYLRITETDRAATTLPMSYCYGLSVVHSHLRQGAALILTDLSVADHQFWELFGRHGGTSFAGVPYTFELLDRVGFDTMELPTLRYITQAGGRLAPESVRRYAELGRRRGFEFFVMYGATEATARMAYLPPDLAATHPEAIGRPIPGGSFTLAALDGWTEPGVGELVYTGPNVMMGYAHVPADLATGPELDALHTGDIARELGDGLYQVIGRRGRFAKLYGLRVDLQRVESAVQQPGLAAMCTEADGQLLVAAAGGVDAADLRRRTATAAGLPPVAVRAVTLPELPVLPSGKPDYPALRTIARDPTEQPGGPPDTAVRTLFADVLHLDQGELSPDASFVSLGANSLSYVAMSIRLERMLGRLPPDWQRRSIAELERLGRSSGPRWAAVLETSVALRAGAIVLIVGSHAGLFELWGGAHILLAVAGYNFGRFCLSGAPRRQRVRHLTNTIAWIAVPSMIWIALALLFTDDYAPSNLVLLQKVLGPHDSMTAGRMWFVEVLVWILLGLAVVCWLPVGDRLERRHPFGFAAAFLTLGLAVRYDLPGLHLGREAWFTVLAFWFFAAGWAAAKAARTWQRALVAAVVVIGVAGYFGQGHREALVGAAILLLIWRPALPIPAALTSTAGIVAEASLFIYLVHFQVYPLFSQPLAGVVVSILVGVGLARAVAVVRARAGRDPASADATRS